MSNVAWPKSTVSKTKLPSSEYARDLAFRAAVRLIAQSGNPSAVMIEVLQHSKPLLQSYGLTIDDFPKPGQSISAIKSEFEIMIGRDNYWYDLAIKAGIPVSCERPLTGTTNGTPPGTLYGLSQAEMLDPPRLPIQPPKNKSKSATKTKSKTGTPTVQLPPTSIPGLEVPDANPNQATMKALVSYKGQRRRAILYELGYIKDQGGKTFDAHTIARALVAKKFLSPDPGTNDNLLMVRQYLLEMGITNGVIPFKFPVLKDGEIVEEAVMKDPSLLPPEPIDEDANDVQLQDLLGELNSEEEPV